MQSTEEAVFFLMMHVKCATFFRRINPGLLMWPSCAVSKEQNVFGMPLQKALWAGVSGCLVSGGWEGWSRVGLGLKVLVRASGTVSFLFFLPIPNEAGHV